MHPIQKSLFALSTVTVSSLCLADATIGVDTDGQNATIMIQNGMVLMRSDQQAGESIYDSAKNIIYIIDHDKKTVTPVDEDTVTKLSGAVGTAMSAVNKQLDNLPPEQRAQIEAMMGNLGLATEEPAAEPTISLSAKGSATYHGIDCEQSEVMSDAEVIGTVCLSKGNSTPLSDGDYQTLLATQSFMFSMAKEAGEMSERFGGPAIPSFGDVELNNLIVHSEQTGKNTQMGGINITSVNTDALTTTIDLPEGYRTEDILSKMPQ